MTHAVISVTQSDGEYVDDVEILSVFETELEAYHFKSSLIKQADDERDSRRKYIQNYIDNLDLPDLLTREDCNNWDERVKNDFPSLNIESKHMHYSKDLRAAFKLRLLGCSIYYDLKLKDYNPPKCNFICKSLFIAEFPEKGVACTQ